MVFDSMPPIFFF